MGSVGMRDRRGITGGGAPRAGDWSRDKALLPFVAAVAVKPELLLLITGLPALFWTGKSKPGSSRRGEFCAEMERAEPPRRAGGGSRGSRPDSSEMRVMRSLVMEEARERVVLRRGRPGTGEAVEVRDAMEDCVLNIIALSVSSLRRFVVL